MPDHYKTIENTSVSEYKDRGSTFIAHTFPIPSVEEFKRKLKEVKEKHPKAAHHCYAYRLGTDGNSFRANDDGEPSGTAGNPILSQIDSKELTAVAIIVVRYFGGTLLGIPGLINAYKTAASLALQLTSIVQKPVLERYELSFDYTLLNNVMLVIKRFGCIIFQNETGLFCTLQIGIPKSEKALCLDKLKDLHQVQVKGLTI
jgi:uncharacterized YigZ family protein